MSEIYATVMLVLNRACLMTFRGSGVRLEPLSGTSNMPGRGGGWIVIGLVARDRFRV